MLVTEISFSHAWQAGLIPGFCLSVERRFCGSDWFLYGVADYVLSFPKHRPQKQPRVSAMKVSFFHLMPYQNLPQDFESKHHSAWVDLPNENFDPELGQHHYTDYLEELQYADRMGFDGVCVNEHHNNAYGIMPSPNLIASVLSRSTSRAALVVLGNSLALYQPPLRVAEEMAMLDLMSGGRLVAGFPVGTSMDTTFSYGQVPITLREKHTEAHDLIMKAWSERGTLHLQRQVQQAPLRQHLAPAPAAAPSAGVDSRKRQPGDLGLGA